ncbi:MULTISPECIES: mercury methylation ferredoxin HgcB [Desulfitobacterium]|uniref:4Fe-4S protein n=1 Tax=Desulfitobacterium dehalogenans (strain ATCC 51507 / DSM 9161 / JW/IU-DC1) TaxID=756499 RepID=I4AAU7_DESDJ|nr:MULTISPECIES: mercury methylation ferredoxin HgcB [Desulfitobacterium]AFM01082.1 4Fe-4S protein [Desulfitobacterium dehalogenans ATCC 51507]
MKNQYLRNVSTLKLEQSLCTGCGKCIEVCSHQVFAIVNSKCSVVNKDGCIECGACVKNCPFLALEVKPGVGCASAIIKGWLTGTEPSCDCSSDSGSCC